MANKLHDDIAGIAKLTGALALSRELLSSLLLERMKGAAAGLQGTVFQTKHELVAAEFSGLSIDPKKLTLALEVDGDKVVAKVSPQFRFTVRLAYSADLTKTFSNVAFDVPDLTVSITGESGNLVFSFQPGPVKRPDFMSDTRERDDAISAAQIDRDELLRVEGMFAYGTGDSVLATAFGRLKNINLATMFPNLTLGGASELKLSTDKEYLLVLPESLSLAAFTGCPPKDPTAGLTVTAKAVPGDQPGLEVQAQAAPSEYMTHFTNTPLAALYAPKSLLDQHFSGLVPALDHYDQGTGVIGHELRVIVSVTRITVGIAERALTLSVGLKLWARATINIEVPCLGRKDIASLEVALPENNGEADVSVKLGLALDHRARLSVQCEVAGISLGTASVKLNLFGGVVPGLYGYVTDFIIGRVLQNNIPWLVHDQVKAALDHKFAVLADLGEYLPFLKSRPDLASFSGVPDSSALMGLTVNR